MQASRKFIIDVEFEENLKVVNEFFATSSDEEVEELFESVRTYILYDDRISAKNRFDNIQYCDVIEESIKSYWINSRLNKTLNAGTSIDNLAREIREKLAVVSKDYQRAKKSIYIGGAIIVASIIAGIIRKHYRAAVHGSCSKYSGRDLILCRLKMIQEFEKVIKMQIQYCGKTTDPDKCKKHIAKSIEKLQKEKEKWLRKRI